MKVEYSFLYKNGSEDVIEQEITQENEQTLVEINKMIYESMKEEVNGVVSFGDGENEGFFVRLSEVLRVKMQMIIE